MRIKEVEKATGLTAKAIRMYESKGLLTVARESENDYRDYSEEDVQRLKTIAVLRRLDISVKEIKEWTDGQTQLKDLIARASYQARTSEAEQKAKAGLTGELLQILEEDAEADLPGAIEEAEELQSLYRELDDLHEQIQGNLFWPVFWTVIAMGPVGWTFFRIYLGQTDKAIWTLVISLLIIPFVCNRWFRYFQVEKKKRKATGCLSGLIFAVCSILLAIGSFLLVVFCQGRMILYGLDGVYLFRTPWMFVAILFPIMEIALAFNMGAEDEEETQEEEEKLGWRGWLFVIGVNLVVLYCCIVSVSSYSQGTFTRHTVFNPFGHTYSASDVDHVEAGFRGGWSTWLPWNEKGDFYYEITFTDGRTENWTDLNAMGDTQEEDPWLLILELDRQLMDAGVEKIANWENREHFQYDPSCLEIADEILNNQ